ncbi:hypothetical protein BH09ACT6_BH09ACT6_22520 [soil metagenome]
MGSNSRSVTQTVLALCLGIGVGAFSALALQPVPIPSVLEPSAAPLFAPVTLEPFLDVRKVSLSFTTQVAPDISIPVAGVLTGTACVKGAVLESGTAPVEVSGEKILALHLSVPPWRDLGYGVRGPDVAALQAELTRIGYDSGSSGRWDHSTALALEKLENSVGVDVGDGDLPVARLVWLPSVRVAVSECAAKLGSQVQAGSALATVQPSVVTARVTTMPADLTPGARVVAVGSASATVDSNGTISSAEGLAAIVDAPEAAATIASIGGASPAALNADLRLADPLQAANVPGSAVRATGETACVFDVGNASSTPVTVLASSLGNATIVFAGEVVPKAVQTEPDQREKC